MKKAKEAVKSNLREQYAQWCNAYVVELLHMWELDGHYGYWNSDNPGMIYHYGDTHNLSMEEIIYIVENDIEESEVLEWEDYIMDANEFGFNTPNLKSWHMGCPRATKETFDRLRKLKDDLNKAIEEEKQLHSRAFQNGRLI